MRELVPLALILQRLAGEPEKALAWADSIASKGRNALPLLGLRGDAELVVADHARTAGLFAPDGTTDRARLAELVIVLDILAAIRMTEPKQPTPNLSCSPSRALSSVSSPRGIDSTYW